LLKTYSPIFTPKTDSKLAIPNRVKTIPVILNNILGGIRVSALVPTITAIAATAQRPRVEPMATLRGAWYLAA
jgi:hypothetical protein